MPTNVYGGPGNKAYAYVGYLDDGDTYSVIWEEYGWRFIEYPSGTKRKRAYLPGGRNVSPSGFSSGILGRMTSAQTVYGGPNITTYAVIGSVSANENVTILMPNASGFAFIEYSSSTGTKRGYVPIGTYYTTGTSALAKMNQDSPTFSQPYLYGTTIGSIFEEEYVVVLQQNNTVSYIEYNTVSGRKRAYVFSHRLNRINILAQVPSIAPYDNFIYAFINSAANVYGGPSQNNYALIGSVGPSEDIAMIHKENDWVYVQYMTTSGPKRGFISATSSIIFFEGTINDLQDRTNSYTGWADLTNAAVPVYAGPDVNYAQIGSVAENEAVTVFDGVENCFYQIEYTTPAGPKRGFIRTNDLQNLQWGGLAIVTSGEPLVVHYTPDLITEIPQYGAVAAGEYVIILEKTENNDKYYIEYNTSSARKRGYTASNRYFIKNSDNILIINDEIPDEPEESSYMALSQTPIYAGPSEKYANVGSVFEREPVLKLKDDAFGYSHIEYSAMGTTKRGYVHVDSLITYLVEIPDFSTYLPILKGSYGTSSQGRDLTFYQIGNGNNHLILNYAIHGFEDHWNHDGVELLNLAGRVLETLVSNITSVQEHSWTVFVIPTSNPDGLVAGYTKDGPGRCTMRRYGDTRGVLLPGAAGLDINRSFDANFNPNYSNRNYTGPEPNWAPESELLRDFIISHKSQTGRNVFIDNHGWTWQIITPNPTTNILAKIFVENFKNAGSKSYLNEANGIDRRSNLLSIYAQGYVARYAYEAHGMEACLFEFPDDVFKWGDIVTKGYETMYLLSILDIINEQVY